MIPEVSHIHAHFKSCSCKGALGAAPWWAEVGDLSTKPPMMSCLWLLPLLACEYTHTLYYSVLIVKIVQSAVNKPSMCMDTLACCNVEGEGNQGFF